MNEVRRLEEAEMPVPLWVQTAAPGMPGLGLKEHSELSATPKGAKAKIQQDFPQIDVKR